MRMINVELALELDQAKAELVGLSGVTRLPNRR